MKTTRENTAVRNGLLLVGFVLVAACSDSDENNPPVAFDETVTVDEDGRASAKLSGTDTDGDAIEFTVGRGPNHGQLDITADGSYSYEPNPDFFGTDSFDYLVVDTAGANDVGTITVIVTAVNDAPVTANQTASGPEDADVRVTLEVSDVDNPVLAYSITQPPSNGNAVIVGGELVYTPAPNYNGPDELTWQAFDGEATASATVAIGITAVNDPPVVVVTGDRYVLRGHEASVDASATSDLEGSPVTYTWRQYSGTPVTLSDTTGPVTDFIAPDAVSRVILALAVSDGEAVVEKLYEVGVANWSSVVGGYWYALGLREDGSLWGWGANGSGQLGDGTRTGRLVPKLIDNASAYVALASGNLRSYALRDDGTLFAFGDGSRGELGNGTLGFSLVPVAVIGGPYAAVAAGSNSAFALREDGTLWSWGEAQYGALGRIHDWEDDPGPGQIGTDNNWVEVRAAGSSITARKADGSLWSWGQNYDGSLATGEILPLDLQGGVPEPVPVGASEDWGGISRGDGVLFAWKADMTLWAAGHNEYGQLGRGSTDSGPGSPYLAQVGSDNDWVTGCVRGHALAIKSDGTLWAWGSNSYHQRGDEDPDASGVPRQVGSDNDWVTVGCGGAASFGIRQDGSLWSWGATRDGTLGIGRVVVQRVATPTPVD